MAKCGVCGNDYDKSFEINAAGARRSFDSFECAIQALAPVCEHCHCRVIGHGVEVSGRFYCCAHCARQAGASDIKRPGGLTRSGKPGATSRPEGPATTGVCVSSR